MKSFSEFSFGQQLGIMLGAAALIVVTGEFLYFPPTDSLNVRREANQALEEKVNEQEEANKKLEEWEPKLKDLMAENKQLEAKLATLSSIVPSALSFLKRRRPMTTSGWCRTLRHSRESIFAALPPGER